MFTSKVTDDDHFMSLSASSQALYLHLSMSADDDGFCNQVTLAMFKSHASVQDLEALLSNRYIYQFENGVIVIKHWRLANALRKDRYTPTTFKEELAKLRLDENGAYTLGEGEKIDWLPNGCQMVAEWLPNGCQMVATGKERIDKDRIGKVNNNISNDIFVNGVDEPNRIEYKKIVEKYNSICKSYPKIKTLSDSRKKMIKARLNTHTVEDIETVFAKAEQSDFLKGGNNRNWSANFDWMLKDSNFAKIMDGNYDNRTVNKSNKNGINYFKQRDYDNEDVMSKLRNKQNKV